MLGISWSSLCRFDGNFDERIDYQFLDVPPGVGVHVQLDAWVFPSPNASAGRMVNQYGDEYSGNVDKSWDNVGTHDQQGTLRLARVNGVDTTYYLAGGKWVATHSGQGSGQAMFAFEVFTLANEWTARKQIRVALDNYTFTGAPPVCP
jgi:hypothetical protein